MELIVEILWHWSKRIGLLLCRYFSKLYLCEIRRRLQFCANKVETFLAACRLVEDVCDGVDLNLGCPQMVAKRGRYGSWLQDEVDLICEIIAELIQFCHIPGCGGVVMLS